jgi:hypothetical protein
MKPGDQRMFKKGNGSDVILAIGPIDITGAGTYTTVTNKPDSVRYHRTLFRDSRSVLIANGRWGFGAGGAKAESRE